MPAPTPVWPVVRAAVVDHRWRPIIIDRSIDNFGTFDHFLSLRPLLSLRSLPISRTSGSGALLRPPAAHIERGLNGETFFVLPGDLAPAFVAPAGVNQTSSGNLCYDFAAGARRGAQVDSRTDVAALRH